MIENAVIIDMSNTLLDLQLASEPKETPRHKEAKAKYGEEKNINKYSAYKHIAAWMSSPYNMNQLMQVIGNIPVHSANFSEVLAAIPDKYETRNGSTIKKAAIAALRLVNLVNNSDFAGSRSVLYPTYAGLTPIPMYAFREQQGIKYSFWNSKDSKYSALLASTILETALTNADRVRHISDIPDIRRWVIENVGSFISYRQIGITKQFPQLAGIGDGLRHMILQTWLASPDIRSDSMILDPWNIDSMPEAYETGGTGVIPQSAKPIEPVEDDTDLLRL